MNQKAVLPHLQLFESDCGRVKVYAENDIPVGIFHDFIMELKGFAVEKMVQAHKQHQEEVEAQKLQSEKDESEAQKCADSKCV